MSSAGQLWTRCTAWDNIPSPVPHAVVFTQLEMSCSRSRLPRRGHALPLPERRWSQDIETHQLLPCSQNASSHLQHFCADAFDAPIPSWKLLSTEAVHTRNVSPDRSSFVNSYRPKQHGTDLPVSRPRWPLVTLLPL